MSLGEAREAVKIALETVYRHIDTVTGYENEGLEKGSSRLVPPVNRYF